MPDLAAEGPPARGDEVDRRRFLKATAAGASLPLLSLASPRGLGRSCCSPSPGPATRPCHHVPVEKNLPQAWVRALVEGGERKIYRGPELDTIAMPVGAIAAGQLYLTGEGKYAEWNLCQEHRFSGYGATNYAEGRVPPSEIGHEFDVTAIRLDGRKETRTLDRRGFPDLRFAGEYPLAWLTYAAGDFPLRVTLEAFSPFIPLNAADSALPATVRRYTVENRGEEPLDFVLRVRMENPVARRSLADGLEPRLTVANGVDSATDFMYVRFACEPPHAIEGAPPLVLADFEGGSYGGWTVEGEAFGTAPAAGTLPDQNPVSGFLGRGLVNTYLRGDGPHGRLRSPEFRLDRPYLNFLIGGGAHEGRTCLNLLVDGQVVRTATGRNNELLLWHSFDVQEFHGRNARIEIVDEESGGWGHVNVDQIQLEDRPRRGSGLPLERRLDFGTVVLGVLPQGKPGAQRGDETFGVARDEPQDARIPWGEATWRVRGLPAGERRSAAVILAWHFPNKENGVRYAERFASADGVARHVARSFTELRERTLRWHDTWYDSTLPRWLLDRLHMPVSNLATGLCEWRRDGRFWAWEGVGCCHGTCTHVWNYAQALARLFPELERSVRHFQDFGEAFDPETGLVGFRGNRAYAADGQCGTVLKAYREHLCSGDDSFLQEHWPRIRKALEFSISHDAAAPTGGREGAGAEDGLIEDSQHNTYDINFEGANTFVGSLYLAALRAGEEMARRVGEPDFARRCRELFERGSRLTMERLFNGEYFVQEVDLRKHPQWQYAQGCLADQLFGQGWAHQLGLGYLYPPEAVRSALRAVWKYNWAPDVGPQNEHHPPERWFARPGEAGLFTCTWPKSDYIPEGVRYREEIWTGIEYQVAGHMIWEGMLEEGLAMVRAVHERYDGRRHNPWNEVECGDHYARALASWGVFTALCGFEYDGPAGRIGFAPRLGPEDFRAAFTAAEAWGTYEQKTGSEGLAAALAVRHGTLALREIALELPRPAARPKATAWLDECEVPVAVAGVRAERRVTVVLGDAAGRPLRLREGQRLRVLLGG